MFQEPPSTEDAGSIFHFNALVINNLQQHLLGGIRKCFYIMSNQVRACSLMNTLRTCRRRLWWRLHDILTPGSKLGFRHWRLLRPCTQMTRHTSEGAPDVKAACPSRRGTHCKMQMQQAEAERPEGASLLLPQKSRGPQLRDGHREQHKRHPQILSHRASSMPMGPSHSEAARSLGHLHFGFCYVYQRHKEHE